MIDDVARAFAGAGATAMRRRKRGSPADVWCDAAVKWVMASRT